VFIGFILFIPGESCRHIAATALALGNIAHSVIQEVMGHTKFTTTQRYIHPDTAIAHKVVNQMGKGKAQ
jgi:integrase